MGLFIDENELGNVNKEQTLFESRSYENGSCSCRAGDLVYVFTRHKYKSKNGEIILSLLWGNKRVKIND